MDSPEHSERQDTSPAARLVTIAARPARLLPLICQMILGIALLIALVLKAYMAVLTDHVCAPDVATLGNTLRCEPTLALMAYVMALSAGFELVHALFREGIERFIGTTVLGLSATLMFLMSGAWQGTAGWREALMLLAVVVSIGGIAWIGRTLLDRNRVG